MKDVSYDVNKDTIMKMLRQDVFGFSADDIESKAKEVSNVISNGGDIPNGARVIGGYLRNSDGHIIIKQKIEKNTAPKKQKKK